jgi:hypothetical protein
MFDAAKLSKVPAQSELYYWADYVELLCLVDTDGAFSAARLAEAAKVADDFMATSPDAQDADPSDVAEGLSAVEPDIDTLTDVDPPVESDRDTAEVGNGTPDSYADFGRAAEVTDNRYLWARNIFRLLVARQATLEDKYPFEVDAASLRITRTELTEERRTYVYYLCCSLLPYVPSGAMQRLTSSFERVSLDVLRQLVPATAEVDLFGTARGSDASRFTGNLFTRLEGLCEELRGVMIAEPQDFHPSDTADNGLDLVAWLPMHDRAPGVPAYFCQCACGREWDPKQYSVTQARWANFMQLKSPAVSVTFMPHYYRKPGDHWYASADLGGLLIDRLRAIRFLTNVPSGSLPNSLVDEAWSFRRTVV